MSKFYFSSVKTFDETTLAKEFEETISTLSNLYSKKSLTSIITYANLSQILPSLLKDKKNQKLFSFFIKSQFNEAVSYMLTSGSKDKLKSLKVILEKVFKECGENPIYAGFIEDFFQFDIIEAGVKTVQAFLEKAPGKVLDYFNTEDKILKHLNPYLMIFSTKTFLKHLSSKVLENPKYIPNIFNLHLSMALFFQGDFIVLKRLYKSIISFLSFIEDKLSDVVQNGSLQEILTNELMQKIIS